jgi:hypothetical protein
MRSENFATLVGSGIMRLARAEDSREMGRGPAGATGPGVMSRLRILAREFVRAPRKGGSRRAR